MKHLQITGSFRKHPSQQALALQSSDYTIGIRFDHFFGWDLVRRKCQTTCSILFFLNRSLTSDAIDAGVRWKSIAMEMEICVLIVQDINLHLKLNILIHREKVSTAVIFNYGEQKNNYIRATSAILRFMPLISTVISIFGTCTAFTDATRDRHMVFTRQSEYWAQILSKYTLCWIEGIDHIQRSKMAKRLPKGPKRNSGVASRLSFGTSVSDTYPRDPAPTQPGTRVRSARHDYVGQTIFCHGQPESSVHILQSRWIIDDARCACYNRAARELRKLSLAGDTPSLKSCEHLFRIPSSSLNYSPFALCAIGCDVDVLVHRPMIISYRGICFPQSAKAVTGLGLLKITVSDLCLLAIVNSLRTYDTFNCPVQSYSPGFVSAQNVQVVVNVDTEIPCRDIRCAPVSTGFVSYSRPIRKQVCYSYSEYISYLLITTAVASRRPDFTLSDQHMCYKRSMVTILIGKEHSVLVNKVSSVKLDMEFVCVLSDAFREDGRLSAINDGWNVTVC
ncbi:hypothetical protein CLF_106060 [Clonorchis sinensis]|uniref:Uncharacterized protein n=1 Tax=Clonorchis sinensis TaxID=79923 RepID=G7YEM6_CLOSI|nr:hypothetical protein CLF_106060 [Clonorchis sinensis]